MSHDAGANCICRSFRSWAEHWRPQVPKTTQSGCTTKTANAIWVGLAESVIRFARSIRWTHSVFGTSCNLLFFGHSFIQGIKNYFCGRSLGRTSQVLYNSQFWFTHIYSRTIMWFKSHTEFFNHPIYAMRTCECRIQYFVGEASWWVGYVS